jgi:enoyl-CoA hydratase/carnithine racemase
LELALCCHILFSKRVGPAEALAMGLVNRISQPGHLMDDASALGETFKEHPFSAV